MVSFLASLFNTNLDSCQLRGRKTYTNFPGMKNANARRAALLRVGLVLATDGLVVATGQNRLGGNFDMVLGTVGNTGDAKGKPTHLHYTIKSVFPCPWQIDHSHQGWKKAFYINPIPYLNEGLAVAPTAS
jgi:hypothetical protein